MNLLNSCLSENRCRAQLDIVSKKRALEEVACLTCSTIVGVSEDNIFTELVHRESLSSTGFGGGVALPHCRLDNLKSPAITAFTLTHPIDFDAQDGKGVDIIISLLVPKENNDTHLHLLSTLAELIEQETFCQTLREAHTGSDVFHLLKAVCPID